MSSFNTKTHNSHELDWVESSSSQEQLPPDPEPEPLPPPRRRPVSSKTGRHCRKWWWLYFLLFIVLVILIVIPIIFVALRNRIQRELNKSTVTVTHITLQAPQPSRFDFSMNTTVASNSDNTHGATLSAFNASFYLPSAGIKNPFLYAEIPPQDTSPQHLLNIGDRSVVLSNVDSLSQFCTALFTSEVFQIAIGGKSHVSEPGLPKYPVMWDKVISLRGWNNLTGMNLHDYTIYSDNPAADGANLIGKIDVPNPSVVEAQMGNVTFSTYTANGTRLGYTLLQYVDVLPGVNTFETRSFLDIDQLNAYATNGTVDLKFVGNSSVNFIGQQVPYFTAALQATTIYYTLNLTAARTVNTNNTT